MNQKSSLVAYRPNLLQCLLNYSLKGEQTWWWRRRYSFADSVTAAMRSFAVCTAATSFMVVMLSRFLLMKNDNYTKFQPFPHPSFPSSRSPFLHSSSLSLPFFPSPRPFPFPFTSLSPSFPLPKSNREVWASAVSSVSSLSPSFPLPKSNREVWVSAVSSLRGVRGVASHCCK